MRSLYPDSSYFEFLDDLCANQAINVVLIPSLLVREFPLLRAEEAKAVYADWYARRRLHRVACAKPANPVKAMNLPTV